MVDQTRHGLPSLCAPLPAAFRRRASELNHLEIFFACTALRTEPVRRHILPFRARRDAFIGPTLLFIVDQSTHQTHVALHKYFSANVAAENTPDSTTGQATWALGCGPIESGFRAGFSTRDRIAVAKPNRDTRQLRKLTLEPTRSARSLSGSPCMPLR